MTHLLHAAILPIHQPFWQFVLADGTGLDLHWPLRNEADRHEAFRIADRFVLFLPHQIRCRLTEKEAANFLALLEQGVRRTKIFLSAHLASSRSLTP